MSTPRMTWRGASGKGYRYWIFPIRGLLEDVPGDFIYARLRDSGEWVPVYIGQTSSLQHCLRSAEERSCVRGGWVTHIHARANHRGEAARKAEVCDLVARLKPYCNKELSREEAAGGEQADGLAGRRGGDPV